MIAHALTFAYAITIAPVRDLFQNMIFTIGFIVALGITLFAEWLFPAVRQQRLFSGGFWQDLVWFFYETILHAVVITTYVSWLSRGYTHFFGGFTIDAVRDWAPWARFLLGFCLLDFLYWLQHCVNHRVPILWQFHALHHSQTELNFFSDFRYHVVEYLVRHTILLLPFLVLAVPMPTIVLLAIVLRFYSRFYHGNIRTNLGPLRFLLVTPQSHRVHHSIQLNHRDQNFGAILSIWDRIFGTQYLGEHEYPETGAHDEDFPRAASLHVGTLLVTPLRQLAHPFRGLWQRVKGAHRVRTPDGPELLSDTTAQ